MKFGEKLRFFRQQRGLDQRTLAAMVGVHGNTISNYESGKTYPKRRDLYVKLAQALEVLPSDLCSSEDFFFSDATAQYGARGGQQAQMLVQEIGGLFAGGELAEEDKDAMMHAISSAYWIAKERNKKYAHAAPEADAAEDDPSGDIGDHTASDTE